MPQLSVQQGLELARQHHQAGRLQQAEQLYRQILALQPGHAEAWHLLGVIAFQVGRSQAAVDLIRQALAIQPDYPQAYNNLANALTDKGDFDEAIAACREALARRADYPEACNNLGNALTAKGNPEEAIVAYHRAIALRPDYPEAHSNLGNALRDQGQLDEAIAACRRAIELNPNDPEAQGNLGNALGDQGALNDAIAAYRRAIALAPNYPEAHRNLAFALLLSGDFRQGWEEYEWRWRCKEFAPLRRNFAQPQWDGGRLDGRRLLLHTEQGLGDTLQFIRYLPLLRERGGQVIIECPAVLQRLLQLIAGETMVVSRGQSLPAFDVHCPLLSLPRLFATTLSSIPQSVPYLHVPAESVAAWSARMIAATSGPKVGLVWAGSRAHKNDRKRSLQLARLAPLAEVAGVRFFSLQKGEANVPATAATSGIPLTDWTSELKDFADTAALLANLDLVITVDTAVAHLAGAMGKPVWTLLPFAPDWRWLTGREDSPWYPTMRLFRQSVGGEWDSVVAAAGRALSDWTRGRGG